MIDYIIEKPVGFIHLVSAILALISGTTVLALHKGTTLHRKIGYVYAISMIIVNVTAFMIYRLFGGFGIFHIAAVISLATIVGGMVPILLRKPDSWLSLHLSCMYWSVMGLYAAFVSEIFTRVPETPFFGMVGIATGVIMFLAAAYFYNAKPRWEKITI